MVIVTSSLATGMANFTIGQPQDAFRARVPSYGEVQFYDRSGEKKDAGIDIGSERINEGGYGSAGIARVIGLARGSRKADPRLRRRRHIVGR